MYLKSNMSNDVWPRSKLIPIFDQLPPKDPHRTRNVISNYESSHENPNLQYISNQSTQFQESKHSVHYNKINISSKDKSDVQNIGKVAKNLDRNLNHLQDFYEKDNLKENKVIHFSKSSDKQYHRNKTKLSRTGQGDNIRRSKSDNWLLPSDTGNSQVTSLSTSQNIPTNHQDLRLRNNKSFNSELTHSMKKCKKFPTLKLSLTSDINIDQEPMKANREPFIKLSQNKVMRHKKLERTKEKVVKTSPDCKLLSRKSCPSILIGNSQTKEANPKSHKVSFSQFSHIYDDKQNPIKREEKELSNDSDMDWEGVSKKLSDESNENSDMDTKTVQHKTSGSTNKYKRSGCSECGQTDLKKTKSTRTSDDSSQIFMKNNYKSSSETSSITEYLTGIPDNPLSASQSDELYTYAYSHAVSPAEMIKLTAEIEKREEDNIYEVINKGDEEESESSDSDNSFFMSISKGRRKHLSLYKLTDWDLGPTEQINQWCHQENQRSKSSAGDLTSYQSMPVDKLIVKKSHSERSLKAEKPLGVKRDIQTKSKSMSNMTSTSPEDKSRGYSIGRTKQKLSRISNNAKIKDDLNINFQIGYNDDKTRNNYNIEEDTAENEKYVANVLNLKRSSKNKGGKHFGWDWKQTFNNFKVSFSRKMVSAKNIFNS